MGWCGQALSELESQLSTERGKYEQLERVRLWFRLASPLTCSTSPSSHLLAFHAFFLPRAIASCRVVLLLPGWVGGWGRRQVLETEPRQTVPPNNACKKRPLASLPCAKSWQRHAHERRPVNRSPKPSMQRTWHVSKNSWKRSNNSNNAPLRR